MAISNLRRTKQLPMKKRKTVTRPFSYQEVKLIKQIASRPEETKQFQFAYGNNVSHTLANPFELSYQQIFSGITRNVGADDFIGNQIRVKGIRIDCMARSLTTTTGTSQLVGKMALVRANYQPIAYTTDQMLKPPDASALTVGVYNQHTRPWNMFNGVVQRVYSNKDIVAVKPYQTAGDGIWKHTWYVDMKNELIKFATGSVYEQTNSDLYLFWILSGINIAGSVTTVGELQFNFTVYYKDA